MEYRGKHIQYQPTDVCGEVGGSLIVRGSNQDILIDVHIVKGLVKPKRAKTDMGSWIYYPPAQGIEQVRQQIDQYLDRDRRQETFEAELVAAFEAY